MFLSQLVITSLRIKGSSAASQFLCNAKHTLSQILAADLWMLADPEEQFTQLQWQKSEAVLVYFAF